MTNSPAGFEHGRLVSRIFSRLDHYARQHALGVVVCGQTGLLVQATPQKVLTADVAFISAGRLPAHPIVGPFPGAPDLAVEVLEPSDRAVDVLDKTQQWLDAGCRIVWLVDSATHTVTVHRGSIAPARLGDQDTLTGEQVVPGFTLPVTEIFAP